MREESPAIVGIGSLICVGGLILFFVSLKYGPPVFVVVGGVIIVIALVIVLLEILGK